MLTNFVTMNMINMGTKKCRHEWWHRDAISQYVGNRPEHGRALWNDRTDPNEEVQETPHVTFEALAGPETEQHKECCIFSAPGDKAL